MAAIASYRPSGTLLIGTGAVLGIGLVLFGVARIGAPSDAPVALASTDARTSRLVTAARAIGRGQLIRSEDLRATTVLGRPPAWALVSPADAVGKVAITDIAPGQLVLSNLVSADPSAAGLAMLVPMGQRVLSIDTTDEIAVGGFLKPGDAVDVEVVLPDEVFGTREGPDRSETRTLLQNIRVVTVGPTLGQPNARARGKPEEPARTLTLAMAPDQVGRFMLARKLGRFFLVLRNPNDSAATPARRTSLTALRGGEAAPQPRAMRPFPQSRPPAPPPSRPVELIVGGQRQIIYPGSR
jgi:pilus assembly protein CpaB